MKLCSGCKQLVPISHFHKHPHTLDRLASRCRKCDTDAKREKRISNKRYLVQLNGGSCELCGYSKCEGALEFHHLDPTAKEFEIGNSKIKDIAILIEEISKCILLCANCHREVHSTKGEVDGIHA